MVCLFVATDRRDRAAATAVLAESVPFEMTVAFVPGNLRLETAV